MAADARGHGIRTTHTGSLPRSRELADALLARERGEGSHAELASLAREATTGVVDRQVRIGLDVVGDGEQSKPSYATYLVDRISGFDGERRKRFPKRLDSADFPGWAKSRAPRGLAELRVPTCTGPLEWRRFDLVEADIAALRSALDATDAKGTATEAFMTAASPGVVAHMLPNDYYPSHEAYLEAIAGAMQREYEAIVGAGFVLQIDCPDLAMARNSELSHLSLAEFVESIETHVAILNSAIAALPPERMRMHVCWGNYEGPHNHDVPLEAIAATILRARPAGLCLEGSNPRHDHEWRVWKDLPLPPDKTIITGAIDSTSNFVEHPRGIADRIVRLAEVVGRDRVMAGSDCGFGTMVGLDGVDAEIAWAKLAALVEGAQIASDELW